MKFPIIKKWSCVLLVLLALNSFGQENAVVTAWMKDLDFVYQNLKQTSSYKTQKATHAAVEAKYQRLRTQLLSMEMSTLDCYLKLLELTDEVADFHNEISGNAASFSFADLSDEAFLRNIKQSSDYNFYPKTTLNLDSLEHELSGRKTEDPEGIYVYRNYLKIAVVRCPDGVLQGIVLETKIPSWERGETMLYLLPKQTNRFRLVMGGFVDKQLFSVMDCFADGEFKIAQWQKEWKKTNHYMAAYPDQKFVFRNLGNNTCYIKLGSFNASNDGIKEAKAFYEQIKDSIHGHNLMVDLRNNGGGGDKSSKQFYELFKKHRQPITVLMNFYTVSNAEQFIVKLRKSNPKVILYGDNTRGMITYGRNYAEDKETPSGKFRICFSDLKDHWRSYLSYEGTGVKPDVYLSNERDWLEQLEKVKD